MKLMHSDDRIQSRSPSSASPQIGWAWDCSWNDEEKKMDRSKTKMINLHLQAVRGDKMQESGNIVKLHNSYRYLIFLLQTFLGDKMEES